MQAAITSRNKIETLPWDLWLGYALDLSSNISNNSSIQNIFNDPSLFISILSAYTSSEIFKAKFVFSQCKWTYLPVKEISKEILVGKRAYGMFYGAWWLAYSLVPTKPHLSFLSCLTSWYGRLLHPLDVKQIETLLTAFSRWASWAKVANIYPENDFVP